MQQHEATYQKADKLFDENLDLYKQRQMIVEHPFGTIKRALGYTYFLTRGYENVKNESYLHFLTYNLKRVITALGIAPFLDALKRKKEENDMKAPSSFMRFELFWAKKRFFWGVMLRFA